MKNLKIFLGALSLVMLSACSTTQHASVPSDDVYYSSKDAHQAQPAAVPQSQPAASDYSTGNGNYSQDNNSNNNNQPSGESRNDNNYQDQSGNNYNSSDPSNSNSAQSQDGNGNTYVTNNYYNDDYYDYAYSARLRRYYTPAYGYGYYDPFYTNLYWYDYNPVSWGVSIYLGYNWWAPSYSYYSPFSYGGFSIGYSPFGYSPYGYSPYYNNWYSPYSYMNGYNHGYMDGYYSGVYPGYGYNHGYNNPYYYNSYDATSTYYGPRGEVAGNSPRQGPRDGSGKVINSTLGQKYQEAIADGRVISTPVGGVRGNGALEVSPRNPAQTGSKDNSNQNSLKPGGNSDSQINVPSRGIITDKNQNGLQPVKSNDSRPGNTLFEEPKNRTTVPVQGNNPTGVDSKNNTVPQNRQDNNLHPATTTPRGNDSNPREHGIIVNPRSGGRDNPLQPSNQESRPSQVNPRNQDQSRPKNYNQNDSRNNNNIQPRSNNQELQPRNYQQKESIGPPQNVEPKPQNNEMPRDNSQQKEISRPKNDQKNFDAPRPRQESRAPVFQPRNEPKQFRSDNNFSAPQNRMSAPSAPSSPSRSNSEGHSGGGRRK